MSADQTPVKPIKQAVVVIAGHAILAVLFENNQIGASIRMICDLLGIDHRRQIRKIRADRAIHDKLILAIVETDGGPQETNVIIAEAIPLWLKGIEPGRVKPEARATLEEFQRVAVQTLRAFFFPEEKTQQHSAPPRPEPEAAPLPPPPQEPPLSGLDHLHLGIDSIGRKDAEQDARLTSLEQNQAKQGARLDRAERHLGQQYDEMTIVFEEMNRLKEQVTNLASTGPLAFAHQVELHTRLKALEHHSGQARGALERELADTFGVQVIEQLAEADWGRILAWFQQRLGW